MAAVVPSMDYILYGIYRDKSIRGFSTHFSWRGAGRGAVMTFAVHPGTDKDKHFLQAPMDRWGRWEICGVTQAHGSSSGSRKYDRFKVKVTPLAVGKARRPEILCHLRVAEEGNLPSPASAGRIVSWNHSNEVTPRNKYLGS